MIHATDNKEEVESNLLTLRIEVVSGNDGGEKRWANATQTGNTSSVRIVNGTVTKRLKKETNLFASKVLQREACVLGLLEKFEWAPRLLALNDHMLTTLYVGVPVNAANIPKDYADQFDQILKDLKSVGVEHGDITYPGTHKIEIMVLDGHLSLIDFGWASVNGRVPCGLVPEWKLRPHKRWVPRKDTNAMEVLDTIAIGEEPP